MSAVPQKYQPSTRLIDDSERLRELYCRDDLTVREIANQHTDYSSTAVHSALTEYGIIDDTDPSVQSSNSRDDGSGGGVTGPVGASERGFDPPSSEITPAVSWTSIT